MIINYKCFFILVFLQINFSFASTSDQLLGLVDPEEIRYLKNILSDLTISDDNKALQKLLKKHSAQITSDVISATLGAAMWDESTKMLGILLDHPKCELSSILMVYKTACTYFKDESETKSLLKQKGIDLLKILVDQPKCELPFLIEIYEIACVYFDGEPVATSLRKKILSLGGNLDEFPDDEDQISIA